MHPDELAELTTTLNGAYELVESINNPALATERGWDLSGWGYDFVPWGVRFLRRDNKGSISAAVVAVTLPEEQRARAAETYASFPWPTTLLLFGDPVASSK